MGYSGYSTGAITPWIPTPVDLPSECTIRGAQCAVGADSGLRAVTIQQFHDQLFHGATAAGGPVLQAGQQLGIQGEIKPLGQLFWIQAETGICLALRSGSLLIGVLACIAGRFCPVRH